MEHDIQDVVDFTRERELFPRPQAHGPDSAWRADEVSNARRIQRALQDDSLTQVVDRTKKIVFLVTPALKEDSYAQALIRLASSPLEREPRYKKT